MRARFRIAMLAGFVLVAGLPLAGPGGQAVAVPNPVATDESTYQAFGRVFPDPHGCLAYGVPDADGNGVKDTPRGVSPWAKGRVCADQFLSYEEVIEGAKFLQRRFPEFISVIRLDQAYNNPNYMSAGLPLLAVTDDGKPKLLGRDRRPLYMLKVTDKTSTIPEKDRLHFSYSLSIHGIERAGVEGGSRAMEDMVTWAACELPKYREPAAPALPAPACAVEGPFPKKLVETPQTYPVPTAGEALKKSVIYFMFPNPDGWARGQVAPVEIEDGAPNANYTPGVFFQRYNGNGVDVNRNWPTKGYTYKPYMPGAQPETKAFGEVLQKIRASTGAGRFDGAMDLHGMLTSYAFSYTLIGAGQRDYRKNALTVETSIRTWQDQTKRMNWSPYVADANANGVNDPGETCIQENVVGGGTRGRIPACVADEWGTVIDTIGYQITGGIGDWMDSPMGLDAIGIANEMFVSHLAPNTVFDPALEQTHIDGNKGL
ncbi:MAG TPA: M14 family zinc carboxypeptidase, partial [Actinomycetota bacterium]|nr:M14 family zinc carboxypeptidase [Actinomycetota bacterium]